jgi:predicted metal-dependent phosphoesterase TrpH
MRFDLHVHSIHSRDGSATPSEIIKQAVKHGIDGLAVTDHNTPEGSNQARSEAAGMKGFVVVRGIEVSAKEGHVLVYGTGEPVPAGIAASEVARIARERGAIAVAAHPYRLWTGLGENVVRKVDFAAVEGLNSSSDKNGNARARKLAAELRKPMTGGSDAHALGMVGAGLTVFDGPMESEDQALDAISKGLCRPEGMSASPAMGLRNTLGNFTGWLGRGMKRM